MPRSLIAQSRPHENLRRSAVSSVGKARTRSPTLSPAAVFRPDSIPPRPFDTKCATQLTFQQLRFLEPLHLSRPNSSPADSSNSHTKYANSAYQPPGPNL